RGREEDRGERTRRRRAGADWQRGHQFGPRRVARPPASTVRGGPPVWWPPRPLRRGTSQELPALPTGAGAAPAARFLAPLVARPQHGEVAKYAIVDNDRFRLLRRLLPGPYTVVLPATRLVPRTALTRQRAVGVRVPDAPVATALVHGLGRPLATTSAALADDEPLVQATDIQEQLGHGLDLILDGGMTLNEP